MAFPSVISTLSTPQATDKLNNPSHSTLHQNENSAILEIERAIGTDSSIIGTIIGDLRNSTSNGGGHVQTANKGGTGQTGYSKGDLLVAQSSSVLTKLAAGVNTQVLTADSNQATGIKWSTPAGGNLSSSGSVITLVSPNSATETSLMSITVPASTMSTSGAVRATLPIKYLGVANSGAITVNLVYGASTLASFAFGPGAATVSSVNGIVQMMVVSKGVPSSQLGTATVSLYKNQTTFTLPSVLTMQQIAFNASADAGASQVMGITAVYGADSSGNRIDTNGYIVERIV